LETIGVVVRQPTDKIAATSTGLRFSAACQVVDAEGKGHFYLAGSGCLQRLEKSRLSLDFQSLREIDPSAR
jgi:hypothetical protein